MAEIQSMSDALAKEMHIDTPQERQTFEDYLQDMYQQSDRASDDPDKANDWVDNLDVQEVIDFAQEWGNTLV